MSSAAFSNASSKSGRRSFVRPTFSRSDGGLGIAEARSGETPRAAEEERTDTDTDAEQHDCAQVVANQRNAAKHVTTGHEREDPQRSAADHGNNEFAKAHVRDPADER